MCFSFPVVLACLYLGGLLDGAQETDKRFVELLFLSFLVNRYAEDYDESSLIVICLEPNFVELS